MQVLCVVGVLAIHVSYIIPKKIVYPVCECFLGICENRVFGIVKRGLMCLNPPPYWNQKQNMQLGSTIGLLTFQLIGVICVYGLQRMTMSSSLWSFITVVHRGLRNWSYLKIVDIAQPFLGNFELWRDKYIDFNSPASLVRLFDYWCNILFLDRLKGYHFYS